jgi:hypothetical protein
MPKVPCIIRMMKSRRMRWAGLVARMGEDYILVWKPERKRPLRRQDVGGWILDRMGWYGLDWSGLGEGPVEGFCQHGNEPSGSIKCWKVLEWLHNWRLLTKGSAPWVSELMLKVRNPNSILYNAVKINLKTPMNECDKRREKKTNTTNKVFSGNQQEPSFRSLFLSPSSEGLYDEWPSRTKRLCSQSRGPLY